ncbi:hypothetical protein C8J31_102109 [Rhizobium sp. PP-CC-2G-626]|nr:hypothetical protein C8J31_102109 [Rhizobium sp. PP-CC-2G-626]
MSPEDFKRIGEEACVSIAADHDCYWRPEDGLLQPSLWEALRVEMQRRFRRSTGEKMAVLTIELTPPPQNNIRVNEEIFRERLQAIIDWADLAMKNAGEFDSHGVRNLDGPVFDAAREALASTPDPQNNGVGRYPIESAPKDGTWFLAYRGPAPGGTWDRYVIVRWHEEFDDFVWPDDPFDIFTDDIDEKRHDGRHVYSPYESSGTFTHWSPLPIEDAPAPQPKREAQS